MFLGETKANITRPTCGCCASGLRLDPAGVESLSDPILQAMRKGVTAFQNVRCSSGALQVGVKLFWNVLYGLPGEPPENTRAWPTSCAHSSTWSRRGWCLLALDRFSPYHERPEACGP